jgi:glycosyltransferase involved in cell wall biosynthesis
MKILFVLGGALRTLGGAVVTTLTFARKLERDFAHRCAVLTQHPLSRQETIGGIEIAAFRDVEELKQRVERLRPAVIVGALSDAVAALRVAKRSGIPGALYLHSYEFCPPTAAERREWGIADESAYPSNAEADFVFGSADAVFVCSRYLQQVLEAKRGFYAEAIGCDFDGEEMLLDEQRLHRGEYITGVCGYRHKGLEIFLSLAERFPQQRFLLAGDLGTDIDLSYRRRLAALPNILLPGRMVSKQMLARSKIVLVPSQWPEPFGRIVIEAMANGIPLLASAAGGLKEILGDAPMRVEHYQDADVWADRLAALIESPDRLARYAREGKICARPFLETNPTAALEKSLRRLVEPREADFSAPTVVAFHGAPARSESDSLVNARWSESLAARHGFSPRFNGSKLDLPDVTVHHDYTIPFTDFTPPDAGALVAVRTSDFGPYPAAWAAKINREFDQLWVYTDWIRQQAIASGIDPERVRLVPLGVDPGIFRPEGERFALPSHKSFHFLFVGTAVVRKGFDILLAAYLDAFTCDDDVSLVIKDHSANAFHSPTYRAEIEAAVCNPKAPEILYIDDFLPAEELAALYRACDAGVFPYRAEGFCLPILEAMACGTPSIVPERGACRDFCSEETSFLVPAIRVRLPVNRRFALRIGVEEDIGAVDFCEVRTQALTRAMIEVRATAKEALARKADAGVRVAHGQFTWERSAERAALCLRELAGNAPLRLQRSRREAEQAYLRFEAARRLLLSQKVPRGSEREGSTAT